MSNRFVISDTHFHHERMLSFIDKSGNVVRPFSSVEEVDDLMISNWNKTVTKRDTIWHLGDVFSGPEEQAIKTLRRLNGNKKLILGNHDHLTPEFMACFNEISLWKKFGKEDMIFSHMPLDDSVINECSPTAINVHGHIHSNKSPTARHFNVSVENINYMPISFDEIRQWRNQNG